MDFIDYSAIGFNAFCYTSRQEEVTKRKKEIIDAVFSYYATQPKNLLFVGFNPAIFTYGPNTNIAITQVTDEIIDYVRERVPGVKHMDWNHMSVGIDKFDAVIAVDEFLTFAETDAGQVSMINKLCGLAGSVVITTLRDYKNQSFKDREFSTPSVVKGEQSDRLFLEYHDYDIQDRNAWIRNIYQIQGTQMQAYTGFQCRQMFFKQCAKFSIDAGASDFLIHKNIMYKSLVKKNYEHVISMRFGTNGRNTTSRQYS